MLLDLSCSFLIGIYCINCFAFHIGMFRTEVLSVLFLSARSIIQAQNVFQILTFGNKIPPQPNTTSNVPWSNVSYGFVIGILSDVTYKIYFSRCGCHINGPSVIYSSFIEYLQLRKVPFTRQGVSK